MAQMHDKRHKDGLNVFLEHITRRRQGKQVIWQQLLKGCSLIYSKGLNGFHRSLIKRNKSGRAMIKQDGWQDQVNSGE